jgi:nicotinamidase-related amidase
MDPKSTALVVVDMNRAHLDIEMNYLPVAPEDSQRIIQNVSQKVLPVFRKYKAPVIYIKTIHRVNPVTGEPLSTASPFWRYQMERKAVAGVGHKRKTKAVEGSPVTEIMPQLEVRPEDIIVVKQRYSPFIGTDMEHIVRCLGIKTFIIVGVNTNNCVLSTSFEAFNRDIAVIVLEDCCASMNGKEYHENAIKQIKTSLGWIATSDMVEGLLNGSIELF